MRFASPSPEATRAAARRLAEALGEGALVIGLVGPLGAGKTVFAKGLAEGLGVDPAAVASPTFVIACEYALAGGRRLAHVDLYRLRSAAELDEIGFPDLLAAGTLVVVEWADRFPEALPADRLEVRIERAAASPEARPDRRELFAIASGKAATAVLVRWRDALDARIGS